jgi:hypothetical protein
MNVLIAQGECIVEKESQPLEILLLLESMVTFILKELFIPMNIHAQQELQ